MVNCYNCKWKTDVEIDNNIIFYECGWFGYRLNESDFNIGCDSFKIKE